MRSVYCETSWAVSVRLCLGPVESDGCTEVSVFLLPDEWEELEGEGGRAVWMPPPGSCPEDDLRMGGLEFAETLEAGRLSTPCADSLCLAMFREYVE